MAERSKRSQLPGTEGVSQGLFALVALGTDREAPVFKNNSGQTIKITGASVIPQAAHSGADTNNITLQLLNRELDGSASAGVAVTAAKEYDSGTDLVAFDEDALVLSSTAANLLVEADEVLTLAKVENGTGLESPDMLVSIKYQYV